jgi:hypothetical protein
MRCDDEMDGGGGAELRVAFVAKDNGIFAVKVLAGGGRDEER